MSGNKVPESRRDPLRSALSQFDSMPLGLAFAIFCLFDSAYGLRYESGLFSLLIHGDPLWMVQFFEFILSSMFILNYGCGVYVPTSITTSCLKHVLPNNSSMLANPQITSRTSIKYPIRGIPHFDKYIQCYPFLSMS